MTPIEAVNCAVQAVGDGLEDGLNSSPTAYQSFLIQSGEYLENSAAALSAVAVNRPDVSSREAALLEEAAFVQILQAAISVFMALAHFPYLHTIELNEVRKRLCFKRSTTITTD